MTWAQFKTLLSIASNADLSQKNRVHSKNFLCFYRSKHPECLLDIVNGNIVNALLYNNEDVD